MSSPSTPTFSITPLTPLPVTTLKKTCPDCPAQWQATLADGRVAYIRYRFGTLTLGVGPTLDDAIDHVVFAEEFGHPFDGSLSTGDMKHHLSSHLDFSHTQVPSDSY